MCLECATKVKMMTSSCPFCRVKMRELVLTKQHSAEKTGGGSAAPEPEGAQPRHCQDMPEQQQQQPAA